MLNRYNVMARSLSTPLFAVSRAGFCDVISVGTHVSGWLIYAHSNFSYALHFAFFPLTDLPCL